MEHFRRIYHSSTKKNYELVRVANNSILKEKTLNNIDQFNFNLLKDLYFLDNDSKLYTSVI